ncbi:MAG TPA: dTDP-4-dehydrorhamnose reductase [Stellaceae bacterium]|nr:dTDP-4-dehydrorhamnose reductase [Stellaceae bacterium]
MKVLVTGSHGQIGRACLEAPWPKDWQLIGLDRAGLDITDRPSITTACERHRPDLVINLAAYTAVDRAESEPALAFAVNEAGPEHLAIACDRRRIPLIHLSTDYVFDGAKPSPYVEEDPVAPLSVYGTSKATGEHVVRMRLDRHIILRTSWVYGVHGANFVKTMLRLAESYDELRVVDDQWGAPTSAEDITQALVTLAQAIADGSQCWGTYHFTGSGHTSWAGFAEAIIAAAAPVTKRAPKVARITTADYPTPARRPVNSRLDCGKIARDFGIVAPDWRVSLSRMLDRHLATKTPGGIVAP